MRNIWVYPHVYGATEAYQYYLAFFEGLSPCVWGHPLSYECRDPGRGSIPMCMGPPSRIKKCQSRHWVYPHVYGATSLLTRQYIPAPGLSPCVWGHLA